MYYHNIFMVLSQYFSWCFTYHDSDSTTIAQAYYVHTYPVIVILTNQHYWLEKITKDINTIVTTRIW